MTKERSIEKLIEKIDLAHKAGAFDKYIEYIRFPFYKNLQINSRIDFNFPITVLVGPNGSGKSSALHAIYGMPEGFSTGLYWFATRVDPIEDNVDERPGFVYGYKKGDAIVEVVKTRIGITKGSHYWEPSRPLKKWGMQVMGGARNPAIIKPVYYLDFRSELSAYDKFFYFSNFRATKTIKTRQDSIRKKSKHLKETIDSDLPNTFFSRKIKAPVKLSAAELKTVNEILGKNYVECKLIYHNLYSESEGLTIYFKTSQIAYSEAFAGRGEFAVVKLVHEIMAAPNNSLIILDEPEVSLHPGAQENLLKFLLVQTLEKKLQIVLSTHSPKFVEYLPENALKLFYPTDGVRFGIKNECHYTEAFLQLGQDLTSADKKIIYVEDVLAKQILDALLSDLNSADEHNELSLIFEVKYLPGGAEDLLSKAAVYSQDNEYNKFVLLDGDKRKPKVNTQELTVQESKSFLSIEKKIKDATGLNFKALPISIDGDSSGGNEMQKIQIGLKYLDYLKSNLEYLPDKKSPEDLIWNTRFVEEILVVANKPAQVIGANNKENIRQFAISFMGESNSATYHSCCILLINEFINKKNNDYNSIVAILNEFKKIEGSS